MSILPYLLNDAYFLRPSRLMDQHFGMILEPEDLLQPVTLPKVLLHCPAGYIRNWKSAASERDSGSTVKYGETQFVANLDVQQFKPEEITVTVHRDTVTIEGKHEEKEDDHGQIFRHFIRKYCIPKNYDIDKIETKLSSDGVLLITAPKKDTGGVESKIISITQTGEPAKTMEKKGDGDKK